MDFVNLVWKILARFQIEIEFSQFGLKFFMVYGSYFQTDIQFLKSSLKMYFYFSDRMLPCEI
jgi:hypothetical protein